MISVYLDLDLPFSWKGGTNLIFLAGSKALGLSEGECLPKPAIFNSC